MKSRTMKVPIKDTLRLQKVPHRAAGFLILMIVLSGGGCAALPLALIGEAASAASGVASGGSAVYSLGKLNDAFATDAETVHDATRAAAGELGLRQTGEEYTPDNSIHLHFVDVFGAKTDVTLTQRAARLSRARVDVGWFGSESTAKLCMDRILRHLPADAEVLQPGKP